MANLYETKHYTVTQGKITVEDREVEGYKLTNKSTGVVEYEETVLPQIISVAQGASDHLEELLKPADVVALNS